MLNDGVRSTGGDLSNEHRIEINSLIDLFSNETERILLKNKYKRSVIRSQLSCSILVFMDATTFWVVGENHLGIPTSIYIDASNTINSSQQILSVANEIYSFSDPFVISFQRTLVNQSDSEKEHEISVIVKDYIETELRRDAMLRESFPINPIFGPLSYKVYDKNAFVLMPFENRLTHIYKEIIQPTLVDNFNMNCRRADEINSNNAIILDIWRFICEARVIIADITNSNPNVMYELGIAHTLGKDTILICQKNSDKLALPFDLSHIRTIIYEDNDSGIGLLKEKLVNTLQNVLKPSYKSDINFELNKNFIPQII